MSEEGKLAVLRAGCDWDVLAVNDLGEGAFATLALAASPIYVRTDDALYWDLEVDSCRRYDLEGQHQWRPI